MLTRKLMDEICPEAERAREEGSGSSPEGLPNLAGLRAVSLERYRHDHDMITLL